MNLHEAETPTVTLDADEISPDMAARLTVALLGQMLYMKGQVPFPVASLGRMVERHPDTKASRTAQSAAKKTTDFLQSYDDLKYHLHTTFVALSTALANNEPKQSLSPPCTVTHTSPSTRFNTPKNQAHTWRPPAKVHVLLILGPSPSAAKARLLLELDGLQVERFGEREYLCHEEDETEEDGSDGESEDNNVAETEPVRHEGDETEEDGSDRESEDNNVAETEPVHHEEDESEEDGSDGESDDNNVAKTEPVPVMHHPRTRSSPPSPALTCDPLPAATSSSAHFYCSHDSVALSPEAFFSTSSISSCKMPSDEEFPGPQTQRTAETDSFTSSQCPEEAVLRGGERLLSRALFTSGECLGFGEEIPPTQAHILIRAPRRLVHPTWVPRQSLGTMLDRHVQRFLDSENSANGEKTWRKGGFGVGLKTVGVRVRCRKGGDEIEAKGCEVTEGVEEGDGTDSDKGEADSNGDMIWWSWDGKLVGFSD